MYTDLIKKHRRALHMIPELRFDLPKTQEYVLHALEGLNCQVSTVAGSGVLAYFDGGRAETVAYRADMDALPVTEANKCEYSSTHPGCMHACGHDAHMAMLLAFAVWVNENISTLSRNVLLVFQPAEESGAGGEVVVKTGCLEQRNVTRAFAIHVDPAVPFGTIASRSGALTASATGIYLDIDGVSGHAAVPGAGKDPLAAAVDFVHGAYEAERTLPRFDTRLIKFCMLTSGNSTNVVPNSARVGGTLRTFTDDDRDIIRDRLFELAAKAEADYGVKCHLRVSTGYPSVYNDADLYNKVKEIIPMDYIPAPAYIGEDFSFYGKVAPAVMFRLGLGTGIPLHSDNFDFDESALEKGVELYIKLAEME